MTSQAKTPSDESRSYLRRFSFLLIALLLTLVLGPALNSFTSMRTLLAVFWSLVLISSVYAVSHNKRDILVAILLALPFFAEEWLYHFFQSLTLLAVGKLFGALFFVFVIYHILRFIYMQREVRGELLVAAAVVYLMIAVMWSYFYVVLEMVQPGSYRLPEAEIGPLQHRFLYFSLVTITTLGYGDITPNTGFAASLSVAEAVIGQLYMTVQVAWLVGIHVASHYEKKFRRTSREE